MNTVIKIQKCPLFDSKIIRWFLGFLALIVIYASLAFYNLSSQDMVDVELITSISIREPLQELFFERFSRGTLPCIFYLLSFGHMFLDILECLYTAFRYSLEQAVFL